MLNLLHALSLRAVFEQACSSLSGKTFLSFDCLMLIFIHDVVSLRNLFIWIGDCLESRDGRR